MVLDLIIFQCSHAAFAMASKPSKHEPAEINLGQPSDLSHADRAPGRDTEPIQHSSDTLFKLASAGLSFLCAGMNDGSLGALIPYILRAYNVNTDLVSVV